MAKPLPTDTPRLPDRGSLGLGVFVLGFFPVTCVVLAVLVLAFALLSTHPPAALSVGLGMWLVLGIYSAIIWVPIGFALLASYDREARRYATDHKGATPKSRSEDREAKRALV